MPIRLATVADAQEIAIVHVKAWQKSYAGIVPDHVLDNLSIESRTKRWEEILVNPETKSTTWVLEADGHILGWCSIGPNRDEGSSELSGEVWAMYVHPDAQRKGVGTALMQQAISALRNAGYEDAILWVLTNNTQGRFFYEATGWKETLATKEIEMGGTALLETRYEIYLGLIH
ncbi:MAG TPA: GNAT family N-acetyltransferase [Fimbriimonadaceae bacterium]|jgi:GNAT superfamily N-acetyltransferase